MTMAFSSPLPLTVVTMSFGSLLSSSRSILPRFSAFSASFSSSKTFTRQQTLHTTEISWTINIDICMTTGGLGTCADHNTVRVRGTNIFYSEKFPWHYKVSTYASKYIFIFYAAQRNHKWRKGESRFALFELWISGVAMGRTGRPNLAHGEPAEQSRSEIFGECCSEIVSQVNYQSTTMVGCSVV